MRNPSDDERVIRELEDTTHEAFLRGDAAALEGLLADGFVSTNPDGSISARSDYISENTQGIAYDTIVTDDLRVLPFGDTVVTLGRVRMTGSADGAPFDATFGFTAAYAWLEGRWQLVAEHVSLLEER